MQIHTNGLQINTSQLRICLCYLHLKINCNISLSYPYPCVKFGSVYFSTSFALYSYHKVHIFGIPPLCDTMRTGSPVSSHHNTDITYLETTSQCSVIMKRVFQTSDTVHRENTLFYGVLSFLFMFSYVNVSYKIRCFTAITM